MARRRSPSFPLPLDDLHLLPFTSFLAIVPLSTSTILLSTSTRPLARLLDSTRPAPAATYSRQRRLLRDPPPAQRHVKGLRVRPLPRPPTSRPSRRTHRRLSPSRSRSVVEFSQPEEAQRAIRELNDQQLLGRPLFIREVRGAFLSPSPSSPSGLSASRPCRSRPLTRPQDREESAKYGAAAISGRAGYMGPGAFPGRGGGFGGGFGGRGGFGGAAPGFGGPVAGGGSGRHLYVQGVRRLSSLSPPLSLPCSLSSRACTDAPLARTLAAPFHGRLAGPQGPVPRGGQHHPRRRQDEPGRLALGHGHRHLRDAAGRSDGHRCVPRLACLVLCARPCGRAGAGALLETERPLTPALRPLADMYNGFTLDVGGHQSVLEVRHDRFPLAFAGGARGGFGGARGGFGGGFGGRGGFGGAAAFGGMAPGFGAPGAYGAYGAAAAGGFGAGGYGAPAGMGPGAFAGLPTGPAAGVGNMLPPSQQLFVRNVRPPSSLTSCHVERGVVEPFLTSPSLSSRAAPLVDLERGPRRAVCDVRHGQQRRGPVRARAQQGLGRRRARQHRRGDDGQGALQRVPVRRVRPPSRRLLTSRAPEPVLMLVVDPAAQPPARHRLQPAPARLHGRRSCRRLRRGRHGRRRAGLSWSLSWTAVYVAGSATRRERVCMLDRPWFERLSKRGTASRAQPARVAPSMCRRREHGVLRTPLTAQEASEPQERVRAAAVSPHLRRDSLWPHQLSTPHPCALSPAPHTSPALARTRPPARPALHDGGRSRRTRSGRAVARRRPL